MPSETDKKSSTKQATQKAPAKKAKKTETENTD
jgi:hypothetical protein